MMLCQDGHCWAWPSVIYSHISSLVRCLKSFLGGSDGKESACNVWDPRSIPGSGRSPGEGNGNPLQYSCLENPMDRGAWQSMGLQRVGHSLGTQPRHGSSVVKNPPADAGGTGDSGSILGSGRFPGRGNDNSLQYYSLENPMDRGAWQSMGSQRVRHDWATNTGV